MLNLHVRVLLVGILVLPLLHCAGVSKSGRTEMEVMLPGGIPIRFVHCPAGKFLMGAPEDEPDREIDEVQHEVTLTKDFWCGKFEVTNRQFRAFRPEHQSRSDEGRVRAFNGDDQPVVNVNWQDADDFCRWASKATGRSIRLLTEAEWEYACRAGSTTQFCFGDDRSKLKDYAWYAVNASCTKPVGLKKPNNWGIHDMHGNVAEWVSDWRAFYPGGPQVDPKGPPGGDQKCWQESSWSSQAYETRSAVRDHCDPKYTSAALGFRVACDP